MSSSDQITNLLSECLLKGYVMTAQHCNIDQTPLFRKRNTKETFCVVCDNQLNSSNDPKENNSTYKTEKHVEFEVNSNKELEKRVENKFTPPTKVDKVDKLDISELIGKKLLQGYTLLDTLCQNKSCVGVPLVRDSKKVSSCVSCNAQYILEKDFDHEKHNSLFVNNNNSLTEQPEKDFDEQIFEKEIEAVQKSLVKEHKSQNNSDIAISKVLQDKLDYLKDSLANSFDPEEIRLLALAIQGCLFALNTLKK